MANVPAYARKLVRGDDTNAAIPSMLTNGILAQYHDTRPLVEVPTIVPTMAGRQLVHKPAMKLGPTRIPVPTGFETS